MLERKIRTEISALTEHTFQRRGHNKQDNLVKCGHFVRVVISATEGNKGETGQEKECCGMRDGWGF